MKYYYSAPTTPIGIEILKETRARNFLMSYAVDGKRWQEYYNICDSLIIDSGAFSVWRSGKSINLEKYSKFIQTLPEDVWAINLDIIPDTVNKSKEYLLECCEQGFQNYLHLKKIKKNILPVYHYRDPEQFLNRYIQESDFICLSADNDTSVNVKGSFFEFCFSTLPKDCKTHALGFTSFEYLKRLPFYSIDSTSWKKCALFGDIDLFCKKRNLFYPVSFEEFCRFRQIQYRGLEGKVRKESLEIAITEAISSIENFMQYLTTISEKNIYEFSPLVTLFD